MMDENLDESLPKETNGLKVQSAAKTEPLKLAENSLQVDISDALSERERVKFTVHTVTNLPEFLKQDFSVSRQHEEFIWLHDRFNEDETYAGFIIPPPPPRPDFDASREKLQKLGEGEGNMTNEEFKKMKQELEAEYLAIFKKTVAMHEVFLTRLAQHPVFRKDNNFKVFLEYEQDLSVRSKNKKERVGDLFKNFNKSTDEMLLSATQKDVDEHFEKEKNFIIQYHAAIKDSATKADKMTSSHKSVADCYIQLYTGLCQLGTIEGPSLEKFINKISETFEKMRKIEGRLSSDEDLKLTDTLKYYMRDCTAAKNLLFRRLRCLANYEQSNKNLDKARAKNKDVHAPLEVADCELAQQHSCEVFEIISEKAKEELADFRVRRVSAFKKNLVDLSELEIKHAKSQIQLLKNCLETIQSNGVETQ